MGPTEKSRRAGVGSMTPSRLIAATWKKWPPVPAIGAVLNGLVHGAHAPASTRHWNVAPAVSDVNVKLGVVFQIWPGRAAGDRRLGRALDAEARDGDRSDVAGESRARPRRRYGHRPRR